MKPKRVLVPAILLLLAGAGVFAFYPRPALPSNTAKASAPLPPGKPTGPKAPGPDKVAAPSAMAKKAGPVRVLTEAEQEIERHKAIDREHLTKIRTGIFAYKSKYGQYPEYLSQLVPEFVTADTLQSPHKKKEARDSADFDHQDPGVAQPSYGYEFSNLEFRDGRTFAEIKEVQRSEWGDVVPLLRCFAYGGAMNMAYGGDVYETALNWEWDAATLDLVEKYGWGPGLKTGEMVKVRVTGADGRPFPGAEVWADGRNYSFDLPNRPYPVDASGYALIPVGVDIDRTALSLRAVAPGLASAGMRFPVGELPQGQVLTLSPVENVSGVALDAAGQPMPNARILLRTGEAGGNGSPVTFVKADQDGRWQAPVHPVELIGLSAAVAIPGGWPFKYAQGQVLDSVTALAGKAEVRAGK